MACFERERIREGERERERVNNIKLYARCYSTVIKVRRYYNSIVKIFAILSFYKFGCWGILGFNAKSILHIPFGNPDVNALTRPTIEMKRDYFTIYDNSSRWLDLILLKVELVATILTNNSSTIQFHTHIAKTI